MFPGVKALSVAAKVLIFVVLVAGFDLLLGYTGIVSFAHTMFFGIGAYGMAMASNYNTRPRAAEVMVDGAQVSVVRRREEVAQLFALESILPQPT